VTRIGAAGGHIATIASLLDSFGLKYVEVPPFLGNVGVAVGWDDDNYVVISADDDGISYVSSGLAWDVSGDRGAILEACNAHNAEFAAPVMFVYDDEDDDGRPWRQSVLLQNKFPVALLQAAPAFFKTVLSMMPELTPAARERLVDRGVRGHLYSWQ